MNKKKFIIYIIAVVVIILATAVVFFYLAPSDELVIKDGQPAHNQTPQRDTQNEEEISPSSDILPDITLRQRTVEFKDGSKATFDLASDFNVAVAGEGLGKARFMDMSPDGRLFVTDMVNFRLSREGRLIILDDFNKNERRFESQSVYLSGLRGPNGIAFYTDEEGNDWLYLALTEHLVRYPYRAGDNSPSGQAEVVAEFPNSQAEGATGVVWHITRSILFHEGTLYVSVGSGCNACEEDPAIARANIMAMNPDGSNKKVYARNIRNAVGMAFADGQMYATANGVDHLGAGRPDDLMYAIQEGGNYGWPHCYESNGEVKLDTSRTWVRAPASCDDIPLSFASFGPHTAPLGLTYFKQAHPALQDSFLASLHGSFRKEVGNGYKIIRVGRDGEQQVFMDGFFKDEENISARPVHVMQDGHDSFFFTDDLGGRLYYVYAE